MDAAGKKRLMWRHLDKLKPEYPGKVHLLRNGVRFDHFQGEFERPEDISDIDGPIAVYVGAIENWFQPEWILSLAEARKELTIIIIGRAQIDLSALKSTPILNALF